MMPKPNDKRHQNPGRPPGGYKYGEPKTRNLGLSLTQTAYDWLKAQGASDYIEQMARK